MVSPASSVHSKLFKEGNNWDKGQERLLCVSSDRRYFGNKPSNAFELLTKGRSFYEQCWTSLHSQNEVWIEVQKNWIDGTCGWKKLFKLKLRKTCVGLLQYLSFDWVLWLFCQANAWMTYLLTWLLIFFHNEAHNKSFWTCIILFKFYQLQDFYLTSIIKM